MRVKVRLVARYPLVVERSDSHWMSGIINSDGALCGSLDRNVLLKTYRDILRRSIE